MTLADTTAAAFSSYARTPRYLVKERARYAFGDIAPAWFCRVEKLKNRNDPRSVHPNSYIVVEGYPRSANSYTRALLKERIPQSAHIAHHVHLPAQIEMAVRWNIPTLVLVRPPRPAAISFVALQAQAGHRCGDRQLTDVELSWRSREALVYWIRYHEKILKIYQNARGPAFVLVPFEVALTRLNEAIEVVNERFRLDIPAHSITAADRDRAFGNASYHLAPSAERDTFKAQIEGLYGTSVPASLQKHAQEVFAQIRDLISRQRVDW